MFVKSSKCEKEVRAGMRQDACVGVYVSDEALYYSVGIDGNGLDALRLFVLPPQAQARRARPLAFGSLAAERLWPTRLSQGL